MAHRTPEFRQGDVFLVRLPKSHPLTPAGLLEPKSERTILAEGEVTGHAHALPADHVELHEIDWHAFSAEFGPDETAKAKAANTRLLRVLKPTDLTHEEHNPIHLDPGDYMVSIQLAFDEEESWGIVLD